MRSSFFESDTDQPITESRSRLAMSDYQKAQMKKGILKDKNIS